MEERSAKQSFLSQEVISKGYDGDLFMSFCESIKGTEIDDYTLSELENIVAQFQQAHPLASKSSDSHEPSRSPDITVPESKVEQPESTKPEAVRETMKKNETSAYSIEAIKMQDNDLSLEEIITVNLKE